MNKFTPGPWEAAPDGNVISEQQGIVERIAVSILCGKARREANARLIAAAPDMLELLERTIKRLEQWDNDNICCDDDLYTDLINTVAEIKGE